MRFCAITHLREPFSLPNDSGKGLSRQDRAAHARPPQPSTDNCTKNQAGSPTPPPLTHTTVQATKQMSTMPPAHPQTRPPTMTNIAPSTHATRKSPTLQMVADTSVKQTDAVVQDVHSTSPSAASEVIATYCVSERLIPPSLCPSLRRKDGDMVDMDAGQPARFTNASRLWCVYWNPRR